jgi:hypothetical protein
MKVSVVAFDKNYSAVKAVAALTKKNYNTHPNHNPLTQIFEEENIRFVTLLLVQTNCLGATSKERVGLDYELFRGVFQALGFGDIERFRKDGKEFINKNGLSAWLVYQLHYILQVKQGACARCGLRIGRNWYGATGFENDHVAENFRAEGEASTKKKCVIDIREIMKMILEMAKTQLTCIECHDYLTAGKLNKNMDTDEINAMTL